jgi:hypothetical protein
MRFQSANLVHVMVVPGEVGAKEFVSVQLGEGHATVVEGTDFGRQEGAHGLDPFAEWICHQTSPNDLSVSCTRVTNRRKRNPADPRVSRGQSP